MNTNLVLRTTEMFGDVRTDIYESADNEMYMTARQLGECLGYADPQKGINTLLVRNKHLKTEKYSINFTVKSVDGKMHKSRLFNERGIYEVAFLSNTDKALDFHRWVIDLLIALRKGDLQLAKNNATFSPDVISSKIDNLLGIISAPAKPTPPNYWLWKKYTANPFIASLADRLQVDTRSAYDLVYDRMSADYGFDRSFAISQYCSKYKVDSVAVIDAIADNPTYQMWFVLTIRRFINETK